MEKLVAEFKLAEKKQGRCLSSIDEFQAKCSSMVSMASRWKDLDSKYGAIREGLLRQVRELALQSKEVEEARRRVELREIEVGVKLDEVREKESELGLLKDRILECDAELGLKRMEVGIQQRALNVIGWKICKYEWEMDRVEKSVQRESKELGAAREELAEVRDLIVKCNDECESKEERLRMVDRELDAKETYLDLVQTRVTESTAELEAKQKLLGELERKLGELNEEISVKEGGLSSLQKSVEGQSKEVKPEKSIMDIVLEVEECEEKLQEKWKRLGVVETTLAERSKQISFKERELSSLLRSIEEQSEQLELKRKEMAEVLSLLLNRSSELQEKENELTEVKGLIRELNAEHESKEKQLSVVLGDLQRKQELLDFTDKALDGNRILISAKEKERVSLEKEAEQAMNSVFNLSETQKKEKELDDAKELIRTTNVERDLNCGPKRWLLYERRKSKLELQAKEVAALQEKKEQTGTAEHLADLKREASERPSSSSRRCRAVNVDGFTSEYPFFQIKLNPTYTKHGQPQIPQSFTKEQYINKDEEFVKLEVGDKVWTVGLAVRPNYTRLCAGWLSFSKDNSLKPGDVCIFELIERRSNVRLKVTILRDHPV